MDEDLTEAAIRPARPEDAPAIAQVNVASWKQAYVGIVPAAYLASLDTEGREARFRWRISDPESQVWVAETTDGRIAGFASVGPSADEDAVPGQREIFAIYLERGFWGSGIARELMRTILGALPAGTPVTLWVLGENQRAQHFYRRHGFTPDGTERIEEFGDASLLELRYRRG